MSSPVAPSTCDLLPGDVFEGPEKKLEVFFSDTPTPEGFRQFPQSIWSDLLVEADCSILHRQANEHFDAYLLSESSLFVYPDKVILKTCGTTRLLLVFPKLLALASVLGVIAEHVHYGHYRYKFPAQQLYPHASFDQERAYLAQHFGLVSSSVVGPPDGRCWYMLCAQQQKTPAAAAVPVGAAELAPTRIAIAEEVFEVAMEGLSPNVCKQFFSSTFPELSGCELASHMRRISGIETLLPAVQIDDWVFDPCGYSLNGLRGRFYYTIHITPEDGFSYASFETNDPQYSKAAWVDTIISTFSPSVLTLTRTSRGTSSELPQYQLQGYEQTTAEVVELEAGVSISCFNFHAGDARVSSKLTAGATAADFVSATDGPHSMVGGVAAGAILAVA